MSKSVQVPDCFYPGPPITIPPSAPTPKHSLYLSNLDDQKFLRFAIKYLYIFKESVSLDVLKCSLSRILVDYYPLAGRLRTSIYGDDHKLEVDCNGEGAVFAEAFIGSTAEELLESSKVPNKSWRKFLYKVEAQSFLDVPPLVIQVTNLRCGGMILCTAINHCLCDGIGTSQFLHAWAQLTKDPKADLTIVPFHERHVLKPREPPEVNFPHPEYTRTKPTCQVDLLKLMQSQPLVVTSFTFDHSEVLRLKKQCVPSLKCNTTFETIAAHTWRSWVKSLNLCPTLTVKLLFSVNVRKKVNLPEGYYGNGFVLACAESTVKDLVADKNLRHGLKLVQQAKCALEDDGYIRSMVDLLEDKTVKMDVSRSLVISQWSRLGLEDVDFGGGKPLHMGPLTSDVYCLFLPVVGNANAVRVLVSVPESVVESFRYHMMEKESWEKDENSDRNTNGYRVQQHGLF
ncbi:fatty alcohol:caffeoyl-CoA acyltransferase-like [Abrus precatorius]|uniref:Fatty alcohol:caffeoyl-CoA acyltransferase-like n=1 Tax=Abrus precatorius TaxID=3816 RepID=A0A8B8MJU7_ABRPR|nr:fatty alcohol:caffeoyl-CoA acyltransferase-like [Abrus precatorius]